MKSLNVLTRESKLRKKLVLREHSFPNEYTGADL